MVVFHRTSEASRLEAMRESRPPAARKLIETGLGTVGPPLSPRQVSRSSRGERAQNDGPSFVYTAVRLFGLLCLGSRTLTIFKRD